MSILFTISYSTTTSYSVFMGYSWTMYSEYIPLLVQDLLIFLLMMRQERDRDRKSLISPVHTIHQKDMRNKQQQEANNNIIVKQIFSQSTVSSLRSFIACTIAAHVLIGMGFFPKSIPVTAILISAPIGILSKVVQLIHIIRNKDAGNVSFYSWLLNAISTTCRLMTVLMSVERDVIIICSLSGSAILNAAVAASVLIYPSNVSSDSMTTNANGHVHGQEDDKKTK
jgi:uncharacterized protein with PQ loop repeat